MDPKSIFKSRMFWFNLAAGAIQAFPTFAPLIPQPWGIVATALVNIVLRAMTTQPVTVP